MTSYSSIVLSGEKYGPAIFDGRWVDEIDSCRVENAEVHSVFVRRMSVRDSSVDATFFGSTQVSESFLTRFSIRGQESSNARRITVDVAAPAGKPSERRDDLDKHYRTLSTWAIDVSQLIGENFRFFGVPPEVVVIDPSRQAVVDLSKIRRDPDILNSIRDAGNVRMIQGSVVAGFASMFVGMPPKRSRNWKYAVSLLEDVKRLGLEARTWQNA